MQPFQILPSTTSHKREPLMPTLEIFARLGLRDLDLNLNHFVERGATLDEIRPVLAANQQKVWIASGGWCDFFEPEPKIQETFSSVRRQVDMARALGVGTLRLFFGRLPPERYSAEARKTIVSNIRRLGEQHPDVRFVFENHDGASSNPRVCREILDGVGLPNVRSTFDPINFEHRGANSLDAVKQLLPLVDHVHLKGYDHGEFCEFGAGEVDLTPVLEALIDGGYRGGFTVEYEGSFDRTLRLFEGVRNAQSAIDRLRVIHR
jgi:sugar phosphate isomerase/epimerase